MNVFDTQIEATIQVTPYDDNNNFLHREIRQIMQESKDRISFSLLIKIKQLKLLSDEEKVQVIFAKILNPKNLSPQRVYKIPLGEILLSGSSAQIVDDTEYTFRSDQWDIRQTIRWNCKNVPTHGVGHYAVALMVEESGNPKDRTFLDCAYFEVI